MKKILFSDIDGTIVDKDQPLCSKDQQAIRQLRQQGGLFAYCTGRNYQETKVIADLFEYDYMVLNNGAMIVDRYDKVIFRKQIAHDTAKDILHYCFTHYPYMHYSFYDGMNTYMYYDQNDVRMLTLEGYVSVDKNFMELVDAMEHDFDIFCVEHPDGQMREIYEIQKYIDDHYPGVHGTVNTRFLDVTVDHCSKGTGILTLAGLIDEPVETYCVGDSYNDISMFLTADHPYTFHRSEEAVKEHTARQVDFVYEIVEDILGEKI